MISMTTGISWNALAAAGGRMFFWDKEIKRASKTHLQILIEVAYPL